MRRTNLVQNIEALAQLPESWEVINFNQCIDDKSGGNKKLKKSEVIENGDIPVIDQGSEKIAGYYNDSKMTVTSDPPFIIFGDHTRIFKYIDFPFIMGADGIKVLKPKEENLDCKFLYYFFQSINVPNTGYNRHFKYLKSLQIPLPPLEEQKRIAAILDAADDYRQKTRALIDKYDELAQSLFLEMFGDIIGAEVPLSEICEINPRKSEISDINDETMVSFVPMANVSETGGLTLNDNRPIKEVWKGYTYFREKDVVFAKITPCMENGKGAIMSGLTNGIGFGTTEFHVLRPVENKSVPEFLFYLTHSKQFRKLAATNMTGSAGQKRVPKDFFSKFKLVPPNISRQNEFAERMKKIEEQRDFSIKNLEKSDQLFNSLLQRSFNGRVLKDLF